MSNTILLVDDDVLVLKSVRKLLENEGYSVEVAKNGDEAYQKCIKESFGLVICDVRMPSADGVGFVRMLRDWERSNKRHTPVIFITGYASEETPIEAVKLQAADYILKPFDIDQLLQSVKSCLPLS